MTIVYYEGERVYFRPVEPADEPLLRRWINDPATWSTVHRRPPTNELREREWIAGQGNTPNDVIFGIVVRDGDRLIGTCGLHSLNATSHRCDLGLCIGDRDARGQGYGTEATKLALRFAFEELNVHRVSLCVFDHNPAGIAVYEKAGFVFEGRDREAAWRHGRWRDMLRYGILRHEWQALNENADTGESRHGVASLQ